MENTTNKSKIYKLITAIKKQYNKINVLVFTMNEYSCRQINKQLLAKVINSLMLKHNSMTLISQPIKDL